jgi:SAM-dependent methyltransferase
MLDLGCGNGAQTILFKDSVRKLVGVDYVSIVKSETPVPSGALRFIQASGEALPVRDASIDLVTSFEVLEHVGNDQTTVAQVAGILKPGGYFLFSVPNKWWLFESHGASVPGLNGIPWNRVPFVGWFPSTIHERFARARTYTMSRAIRLAANAGLTVVKTGYITAPLDVLPEGRLRSGLRKTLFRSVTTNSPFLAVNLFVCCQKPTQLSGS